MNKITIPILEASTGESTPIPPGFENVVIPEGMSAEDQLKLQQGFLQNIVNKEMELDARLNKYSNKVEDYKKELEKERSRNIEIIGLFSSVLALLIVDVSIIKSVESFFTAILLIVSLTCSMAIFAVLIHTFFCPADKAKFNWSFWFPIGILLLLTLLGITTFIMKIDLYQKSTDSIAPTQMIKAASPPDQNATSGVKSCP